VIPRSADGGLLRIVHRTNTLAAVETALAAGLDGIELDVISHGGRLVLAHSPEEREPDAPPFGDALALAEDAVVFVDLKQAGIEDQVAEALRGRERTVVCSLDGEALRTVRRLEPKLATSLSYPADRLKVSERGLPAPVLGAAAAALRAALPYRIARMLARAEADAATLHHLVLSPRTVARCHARGAVVIAWTVNDPAELERVVALGVDGVVTDDPEVFARATIAASCGDSPPS
jgi:glycerophosphoryl diester phosphodiesterase